LTKLQEKKSSGDRSGDLGGQGVCPLCPNQLQEADDSEILSHINDNMVALQWPESELPHATRELEVFLYMYQVISLL
jgi:transcription initiation factor IIE alpha subunit